LPSHLYTSSVTNTLLPYRNVSSEFDTPGDEFYPPLSSVKMILSLDSSVKLIEEDEGNEEQCVLLNTLHTTTTTSTTTAALSSNNVSDTEEGEVEEGEYALRARAIATAQGDWDMDMDVMARASTDTYVLFTVCDVASPIEVKCPKGIFDSFMPSDQDDGGDCDQA
jgi:hypothetical protein